MKNFVFILIGVSMGVASSIFAQVVQENVFKFEETKADFKYATTTFETLDGMTIVKENYNNNQEISKRLDKIILLLRQQNAKK